MSLLSARRASPPAVHSKELLGVKLLKNKEGYLRYDVGPFYLLYFVIVGVICFFGSKFDWERFTIACYGIGLSALLHVLVFLFQHWSVNFKAFITTSSAHGVRDADAVLAVPAKLAGSVELVPLERRILKEGITETIETSFEFRKQRFIYDPQQNVFEQLKFPVKEKFEYYAKAAGHGTEQKALAAFDKYGLNKVEVPISPFGLLLKEQLLAPFFVFQVFCVGLWCLDEYWYYSMFTLVMLVGFECTVVNQRMRNLKELRSLQTPKQHIYVYRCGKWELLPGEALLPGDIISIGRPLGGPAADEKVVPADCLLLAGSCIVEEAVLTGESTPQWKVSIADLDPNATLNTKEHKNHMLFGGTKILQHTGDKAAKIRTPDNGCLAMVLRTGFETAQGRLMRTILFSTERITANSLEAGVFILFLLVFALAAAYYVLSHGLQDPSRDRFKLILNCIMIITSVIPPELPMELSLAVNASLVALARKKVFCTEPFRIPFAGKVEVCCFDKTGTLTSDHLLLEEVVGTKENHELIMATCHSLVLINDEIIGDPLEKAALEAVHWIYANDTATSPDRTLRATILHRHHFSSTLKRMSVIVRVEDNSKTEPSYQAVLKGAPEMVKQFLGHVPANYDALYKSYAAQGARVIALAYKPLSSGLDAASLRSLLREDIEVDMVWAGFAIFQCPLKEDSAPALRALRESSHQLVMITGDAPLTACYAASQVHITTRDVLVLSHKTEERGHAHGLNQGGPRMSLDLEYQWSSPDDAVVVPFSRNWRDLLLLASRYDLAISGDALAYVETIGLAPKVIPLCQVFARVSPEQKELVIVTLRASGLITLMCGDGTNDVGGLKAAHVGVALLSASEAAEKMRMLKAAESKNSKDSRQPARTSKDAHGSKHGAEGADWSKKALTAATGPGVPEPPAPKAVGKKAGKRGPGEEMLERMRRAGRPITPAMEKMAKWMDEMDDGMGSGEVPMLKPGDASMASPFTAKSSSVMPCTDIIKQGRSTLVTTVQMFKILGLLCLSTAYALSVMYLQGVKLSDIQATLTGMLTAAMFFFISQAKPLDKLSKTRPHQSIFNPYFFLSLLGQFSVHLCLLIYMYQLALSAMPAEDRLGTDSEFKPNLVNTVCYIVEVIVQLSTFTVNYVGHPFNMSIKENRGMYSCLFWMTSFLIVVTFEVIPGLAQMFGLVSLPFHFKTQLAVLGFAAFGLNYTLEHSLRNLFPARTPPEKGYQAHINDTQLLQVKDKRD